MKIGDLCTYAPKSSIKAGEAISNGEYMFFTSSADENKRYSNYQLDCEAIIMGTGGNATLHYYNGKFSTSTDCVVLIPNEYIRCKYLYYFFLCNMVTLENGFKGAGLKHTNKNYISNIEIYNLPNIETQDKIIKALDMVFEIKFYYQQQLQKLDELVKSRFIEMFGDPLINSLGLTTKPMTEVCEIIDGDRGKNYPSADEFMKEGYCLFLNAKNVTFSGFNFDNCMFISKEKDEALRKGKLTHGDVVLTTRGTLGNLAFYTEKIPFKHVRINSGMVILRMKQDIVNEIYFIEQFKMQLADIKEKIASGSAQPQLPISTMNKIQLIIPNIEKQNQFADFVRQIDKSKLSVQQALDKAQELFDSLMQKFFEGGKNND